MKPRIGITADLDKEHLKLKNGYVNAVVDAGGLPFIFAPVQSSPLPGEEKESQTPPHLGGGKKSQMSPLPLGERDRVRGYVEGIADAIDGLLLTGGDDIPPEYYGETLSVPPDILKPIEKARIDFEISLFKEIRKRQKPILGICYGMQMVNVALGGSLYQDIGIQVHNPPSPPFKKGGKGGFLNHKQGQHEVKIIHDSPLTTHHSPYFVNSTHHQAVKNLAHGLEAFALSEDGIVEGFYLKNYPFLVCVQWHPERGLGDIKGPDGEKYKELSSSLFKAFVSRAKKIPKA